MNGEDDYAEKDDAASFFFSQTCIYPGVVREQGRAERILSAAAREPAHWQTTPDVMGCMAALVMRYLGCEPQHILCCRSKAGRPLCERTDESFGEHVTGAASKYHTMRSSRNNFLH